MLPIFSVAIASFQYQFPIGICRGCSGKLTIGNIGNGNTITLATFTAFPASLDREENPKDRYMRCRYRRKSEFGRGRLLLQSF